MGPSPKTINEVQLKMYNVNNDKPVYPIQAVGNNVTVQPYTQSDRTYNALAERLAFNQGPTVSTVSAQLLVLARLNRRKPILIGCHLIG